MRKVLFLLIVVIFAVGMSLAQATGNTSNANPDQNTAQQSTTTNTQNTTTTNDQGTAAHQNANPSDQATAASDQTGTRKGRLPQTASPLPLLALLGLGSLGAGIAARKRK